MSQVSHTAATTALSQPAQMPRLPACQHQQGGSIDDDIKNVNLTHVGHYMVLR